MTDRILRPAPALAVAITGVGAAYALVGGSPGIGFPLVAVAVGACIIVEDASILRSRNALIFGALSLVLATMPAVRDAEWIVAIDLLAALGLAFLSVTGVTSWASLLRASSSSLTDWFVAPFRTAAALTGAVDPSKRRQLRPLLRGSMWGTFLVFVFGILFVSADSAFAQLTSELLTPSFDARLLPARAFVGVLAVGCAGGLVLSRARARTAGGIEEADPFGSDETTGTDRRPRAEWIVPLALLDALFIAFVAVQITVLFGGEEHVVETAGVSYAEYARGGFFQLLTVAFLTLLVIVISLHVARPREDYENAWLRALLGTLCICTLIILVSAYLRLTLYEETYGFTRLRIAVHGTIVWLGALFALVIVAGARMKAPWLPKACATLSAVGLIVFTLIDPDAIIARENVDRFERTGKIDAAYAAELSSDALPHLLQLPDEQLACILPHFDYRLGFDEPWTSANFARARARELLEEAPDFALSSCDAG